MKGEIRERLIDALTLERPYEAEWVMNSRFVLDRDMKLAINTTV